MQAAQYTLPMSMTPYQRLFGAGPRGIVLTIVTFPIAYFVIHRFGPWPIHHSAAVGYVLLGVSLAATLALAVWSLKSLPPDERGNVLVDSGAFRYFRHPLYATFLTFFDFGLAIYLNDWAFLVWAFAQHPIWHLNIRSEEQLMRNAFGDEYAAYCNVTGRFVPRLWRNPSRG